MDQWESVRWHSCVEVAQSGVVMWHTLLEVAAGVYAYLGLQIVPKEYSVPKLYPEKLVIKSQPLICLFNMFYLLLIYFNSSTCPKILKFLSKISKFMVITPVIFYSHFTSVSLC
jgi:hypothetical protein